MLTILCVLLISVARAGAYLQGDVYASQSVLANRSVARDRQTLSEAQSLFYTGRYDAAAALTLEWRSLESEDLAAYELRASALLFLLKATLGDQRDKDKGLQAMRQMPGADGCLPERHGPGPGAGAREASHDSGG